MPIMPRREWIFPRDSPRLPPGFRHGKPIAIPLAEGSRFSPDRLIVWKPITLEGEIIGVVFLEAGLHRAQGQPQGRHQDYSPDHAFALCCTYPISLLFQKTLSRPILELAQTMTTVSQRQDYTVRAVNGGDDELGDLISCFNDMLIQIERRDEALAQHREHLEEEVARRTAELSRTNQELEQAVQEIQESEQHLSVLMERLGAGVMVVDAANHHLAYVNPYAAEVLGASRDQLNGAAAGNSFAPQRPGVCATVAADSQFPTGRMTA